MSQVKKISGKRAGEIFKLVDVIGNVAITKDEEGIIREDMAYEYSHNLNHPVTDDIPDLSFVQLKYATFPGWHQISNGIFLYKDGKIRYRGGKYDGNMLLKPVEIKEGTKFIILNNKGRDIGFAYVNGTIRTATKVDASGDGKIYFESKGEERYVYPWNIYVTDGSITKGDKIAHKNELHYAEGVDENYVYSVGKKFPIDECRLHRKILRQNVPLNKKVTLDYGDNLMFNNEKVLEIHDIWTNPLNYPCCIFDNGTTTYVPVENVVVNYIKAEHIFIPEHLITLLEDTNAKTRYTIDNYVIFEHDESKVKILAKKNKKDRRSQRGIKRHKSYTVKGVITKYTEELYERLEQLHGKLYHYRKLSQEDEIYGFIMKRCELNPHKNKMTVVN